MSIQNVLNFIEHFFILPLRWFRLHCRNWQDMQQRCKVCGCGDKFNYNIPDEIWESVIPALYRSRVVCLSCFDSFAKKKGVDYSTSLKSIYFAGSMVSCHFIVSDD